MMLISLILTLIIYSTNAVQWSSKLPPRPKEFANKEGCYIKEIDDVISFDESINALGFCYLIHCTKDKIDYVSCGVTSQDESCTVVEADLNEPYPACCPNTKCYESNISWLPKISEQSNTTSAEKDGARMRIKIVQGKTEEKVIPIK